MISSPFPPRYSSNFCTCGVASAVGGGKGCLDDLGFCQPQPSVRAINVSWVLPDSSVGQPRRHGCREGGMHT